MSIVILCTIRGQRKICRKSRAHLQIRVAKSRLDECLWATEIGMPCDAHVDDGDHGEVRVSSMMLTRRQRARNEVKNPGQFQ